MMISFVEFEFFNLTKRNEKHTNIFIQFSFTRI